MRSLTMHRACDYCARTITREAFFSPCRARVLNLELSKPLPAMPHFVVTELSRKVILATVPTVCGRRWEQMRSRGLCLQSAIYPGQCAFFRAPSPSDPPRCTPSQPARVSRRERFAVKKSIGVAPDQDASGSGGLRSGERDCGVRVHADERRLRAADGRFESDSLRARSSRRRLERRYRRRDQRPVRRAPWLLRRRRRLCGGRKLLRSGLVRAHELRGCGGCQRLRGRALPRPQLPR